MYISNKKANYITLATIVTGLSITIPMMVGLLPLWVITFPLLLSCVPLGLLYFMKNETETQLTQSNRVRIIS